MAKVEMELSELDALREALKEAKKANKILIKQADYDRQIHAKEIDALKSGTLVIERTPIIEIKQYTKEKTLNEILEVLGYKIEKDVFGNKLIKINQ